jgi:PAS domain S-box-containing protein
MKELSITNMRTYESTTGEMVEINEAFLNTCMEMLWTLFEEGKVSDWESYYLRKDGIIVPVEMKLSHLYDEIGDNIGAVGVIRDITERRKAEKEIIEARDFLENIFKTTADGIIVTDNEGFITKVNDAMEEITGYPRAELLKQHVTLLTPTDNQHYSEGEHEIEKLVKEGVLKERESLLKRKDGQCIIIETNMSLLFDKKGQTIGCVGINSDITERKKMEQQLLQSEKLKSLGELSGGVAHDFNNVLAAILGRVQLLKMQIKAPLGTQEKRESALELKKGLEIIEKASLDGAETVRRIQEFSRRRTDDKDFTQVDLNELIDNALEFTRVRWKNDAESKGIKIRIRKELSPLNFTLGSSSELREVFTNLINNAIDAMPQGGEIRINSLMNNNNVVVKIGDTGGGIPKDIKDRVFDPFFTTKGVQSTGLGLSVSYGIINRHRGTITVNSVEGEGTTFTIKFPITKKTGEWKVKEEKVVPIKRKQQKASILLIEDEEGVRHLLRDILTGAGHNVEVAADGNEGIEIFKKKKFDLVFTDLGMPVMSGWEVAEKVKRINDKVPVALITGWNVALDSSKMNDSGMDLVIHKPFKMEQVLNLVQEGMILRDQLKAV